VLARKLTDLLIHKTFTIYSLPLVYFFELTPYRLRFESKTKSTPVGKIFLRNGAFCCQIAGVEALLRAQK